jgi:hypothetical protein
MPNTLDYESLEAAAVAQFPPEQFDRLESVPLFDEFEQQSKDESGKPIVKKYDKEMLEKMVEAWNYRIADSNDFCPSVIGHTPAKDDPQRAEKLKQIPIIGFYGPAKLVKFGKVNPRWAIAADEFVDKSKRQLARENPRRSVELWNDLTIDPVARLGAQTPNRDLGLRFYRGEHGTVTHFSRDCPTEKFEAAAAASPSSSNSFVPSDGAKKKPERMEAAVPSPAIDSTSVDPQMLRAVMQELQNTDVWQWIQEQREKQAVETMNANNPAPADMGLPQPGAQPMAAPQPMAPLPGAVKPTGEAPPMNPATAQPELAEIPADSPAHPGHPEHMAWCCKMYKGGAGELGGEAAGEAIGDAAGGPIGGVVGGALGRAAGSAMEGEDEKEAKKHAAGIPEAGSAASTSDGNPPQGQVAQHARKGMPTQMSREQQDFVIAKAQNDREVRELRQRVEKMERQNEAEKFERINSERHAKLDSLHHQGYIFDVAEAAADCKASEMTDEGFTKYAKRIIDHYEKAPVGRSFMPTPKLGEWQPVEGGRKNPTPDQTRQARELVLQAQKQGDKLAIDDPGQAFNVQLAKLCGSNGQAVPAG